MDVDELKIRQREADEFCVAHLMECCRELVEWSRTGILCEGKVRKLATMFAHCSDSEMTQLRIAERTVQMAAVELVGLRGI